MPIWVEGQDEGARKIKALAFQIPSHPNPLPEGEGVNGTAVQRLIRTLCPEY
jgi:hypothetical protein